MAEQVQIKSQACINCAKRKVRCDRRFPSCSNCQRRKTASCEYPEDIDPSTRIKRLGAYIRLLGGDPDAADEALERVQSEPARPKRPRTTSPALTPNISTHADKHECVPPSLAHKENFGRQPVLVSYGGESLYVEQPKWSGWSAAAQKFLPNEEERQTLHQHSLGQIETASNLDGFAALSYTDGAPLLWQEIPSQHCLEVLWRCYLRNVHPLLKLFFEWQMYPLLRQIWQVPAGSSSQELAFVFCLCLITTLSLSDTESIDLLGQPRAEALTRFQRLSEQALLEAKFLSTSSITIVQCLVMYLTTLRGWARPDTLWSLMGMLVRKAERLGLHKDGTAFHLPPLEVELRRRVWWALIDLDIPIGVLAGGTSLQLMSDWDVKLPLNIEDDDIKSGMTEFPDERPRLTSISHCLWRYWVLEEQRKFKRSDGSRYGFTWVFGTELTMKQKDALTERLEEGLRVKFLQYIEPLEPLHTLIQIRAKAFVNAFHQFARHPSTTHSKVSEMDETNRKYFFELGLRRLEYDVLGHTTDSIKQFAWGVENFFNWTTFVHVLIEARQRCHSPDVERIWTLIGKIYDAYPHYATNLKKPLHAVAGRLVFGAWRAYREHVQAFDTLRVKPPYIILIERFFDEQEVRQKMQIADASSCLLSSPPAIVQADDEREAPFMGYNDPLDWDLDDVDWAFWGDLSRQGM